MSFKSTNQRRWPVHKPSVRYDNGFKAHLRSDTLAWWRHAIHWTDGEIIRLTGLWNPYSNSYQQANFPPKHPQLVRTVANRFLYRHCRVIRIYTVLFLLGLLKQARVQTHAKNPVRGQRQDGHLLGNKGNQVLKETLMAKTDPTPYRRIINWLENP